MSSQSLKAYRMDVAHSRTDERLQEIERELVSYFVDVLALTQEQMHEYLLKYADEYNSMLERYEEGEISKEYLQQWLGVIYSGDDWNDLTDQIAQEYNDAQKQAGAFIAGALAAVYALNHNYVNYQFEQMFGDLFGLPTKSDDLSISDRYRMIDITINDTRNIVWNKRKVEEITKAGLLRGESIDTIAANLSRLADMDYRSSVRLARTSVTATESKARLEAMKELKAQGVDVKKTWMSTLDNRTRHTHAVRNGMTVDLEQPFDAGLQYPGDPDGAADETENCRCTLTVFFDENFATGLRRTDVRNADGTGAVMTYDEWLEVKRGGSNS